MNRVYNVSHPTESVYYAVGGENRAKAIISYLYDIGVNTSDFIYYRAKLARDYDGKTIETKNQGLLTMEELMPLGYRTWWKCAECSAEHQFEYVILDRYKCKNCGHIGGIPFVE